MHLARRYSFLAFPILVAFTAIACGQGNATLSPTGPTASLDGFALSADASGTASTDGSDRVSTLDRDNNGKGGGDSEEKKDKEKEDRPVGPPERGTRGELSGFVTATTGTSLTVRGITVTSAPDAVIRHGNSTLLFASIAVGNHVQARGTIDDGTLVATEIKVERTDREGDELEDDLDDDDDDGVKVAGQISGLPGGGTCPAVSFAIGTKQVTTSASTKFEDVTCATLANGLSVEVKGILQANGSIAATKVELD